MSGSDPQTVAQTDHKQLSPTFSFPVTMISDHGPHLSFPEREKRYFKHNGLTNVICIDSFVLLHCYFPQNVNIYDFNRVN